MDRFSLGLFHAGLNLEATVISFWLFEHGWFEVIGFAETRVTPSDSNVQFPERANPAASLLFFAGFFFFFFFLGGGGGSI